MKKIENFINSVNSSFDLLELDDVMRNNEKLFEKSDYLYIKIINYNQKIIDRNIDFRKVMMISEEKNVVENLETILNFIETDNTFYIIELVGYSKKQISYERMQNCSAILLEY